MEALYEIAVTVIIEREGKYLLTRRALNKKRWPGLWTVPGGRFEKSDYEGEPKDSVNAWYNVLERAARREVKEEVGLEVSDLSYLTSIVAEYPDGRHSLILSMVGKYKSGDLLLQKEELEEARWCTSAETKELQMIDGIYDELVMADHFFSGSGGKDEWKRAQELSWSRNYF